MLTVIILVAAAIYLTIGIALAVLDWMGALIEAMDLYADKTWPEPTVFRFIAITIGWPLYAMGFVR